MPIAHEFAPHGSHMVGIALSTVLEESEVRLRVIYEFRRW